MYSIFFFPLISACFQTSEDSPKQNLNEGSIVIEMSEIDFGDVTILSNMETSREIEIQNDYRTRFARRTFWNQQPRSKS